MADSPSTMKLFDRLRWLPTDSPTPGTAEVSAKSCVLLMLGGATPGASSAMSRKLRPFSGSCSTSAAVTVAAIWLRADSSTGASACTVTLVATPSTASTNGISNAAPTDSAIRRCASLNPASCTISS